MYYRRSVATGGTFFFTVNLADRSSRLLVNHINILRDSVRNVQQAHVSVAVDWPYSSIHRYVRQGMLPVDWAVDMGGSEAGFGE